MVDHSFRDGSSSGSNPSNSSGIGSVIRTQHTIHAVISFISFLFVVLCLVIPTGEDITVAHADASAVLKPQTASRADIATPRRGKFVGDTFDGKDLFEAYTEIKTEYYQKAFAPDVTENQWKVLAERDGVQVAMMEHSSDPNCPYVRMTATIPTSVEDCWDFLQLANWDRTMPKMDPFYEGVTVYGEFMHKKIHMLLARKRTQRILAFGKRDFVFLSVSDQPNRDGTWVSGTVSVRTPQIPRQEGYTRAFQDSIAFYAPQNDNQETRVTIVCRIDLNDSTEDGSGGLMPMWLYVKTIGSTGARSVLNMRKVLMEQAEERDATKEQRTEVISESKPSGLVGWIKRRMQKLPRHTKTIVESDEATTSHRDDGETKKPKALFRWSRTKVQS